MYKKISIRSAAIIAAASSAITFAAACTFAFQVCGSNMKDVKEFSDKYQRLHVVDEKINEMYYKDVDEESVLNSAIKGLVSGLDDKYSKYMTPEEYEQSVTNAKGSINGVGITANMDDSGYILVIEVKEDSPAAKAGIKPDDLIVAVNGKDVAKTGYQESVKAIRGKKGTNVTVTVRRNENDSDYTLTRQEIQEVTASGEMLENNIGYIRITHYKETTESQFNEALDKLVEDGAKAIVFDVRDNGGGLVSAVEGCLDPLLPKADVATAIYRDGSTDVICRSDADELDLPMAVLVNGGTASAAELFASALRDFDKAVLIGENTFGKGIMQDSIPLDDGGGLTITIAKYKTAKSECYHGVGLKPDYTVALPKDTDISKLEHTEDAQLKKALSVIFNKK